MGDLLESQMESAARHLEAHPELPGWVLWYVTDLSPRSERKRTSKDEAKAAARYGLHVQTLRVQLGDDAWGYFTFAARTPDLTPEEVARVLAVYLAPGGGDADAGDDERFSAADEAIARGGSVGRKRGGVGVARVARWALAAAVTFGAITAFVLVFALAWGPALDNRDHRLPFESVAWKADARSAGPMWPTRLRMADHLLGSGVLNGKTRAEVAALLGPPDGDGGAGDGTAAEMRYYLGPERGAIRIDSEVLSVRFGPDGRVAECYLWRD